MTNQRTTGQNFLYAIGIACLVAGVLGGIYDLLFLIGGGLSDQTVPVDTSAVLWNAFFVFRQVFLCSGPIILIVSFALLQRFRIKP